MAAAVSWLVAIPAGAEPPAPDALLAELGFTAEQVAQIQAGQIVHAAVAPASERELAAGLAFQLPVPPARVVQEARSDLLDAHDPSVTAFGVISDGGSEADFAKLRTSARGPAATSTCPPTRSRPSRSSAAGRQPRPWRRRSEPA